MKISVKKAAPDVFSLSFDDTEIAVDKKEIKSLLLKIIRVLHPGSDAAQSAEERASEFMRHIKNANDLGVQRLLRVAKHDDILVLLKTAENDEITLSKFYGNMTETSKKIIAEDLEFQFGDDIPGAMIKEAIERLVKIAKDLEDEGTLFYENVITRHVTHGAEED